MIFPEAAIGLFITAICIVIIILWEPRHENTEEQNNQGQPK